MGPEECHKSDQRAGAPLLRKVESMEVVQHGQGLWGDLIAAFQYIKWLLRRREKNFLPEYAVMGQEAAVLN